jgi:hypothetical protein
VNDEAIPSPLPVPASPRAVTVATVPGVCVCRYHGSGLTGRRVVTIEKR